VKAEDMNDAYAERGAGALGNVFDAVNDDGAPDNDSPAFSEDALASEFTNRHGDQLRYVAAWGKWMRWDGASWRDDSTLSVYDDARLICREMAAGAYEEKLSRQMTSAKTVAAVVRLAQADRIHAAVTEQWNVDDFLLNTPAGTVDLGTGALRPHRRLDYLTKITRVAPDFEHDGAVWLRFLDVIAGDLHGIRAHRSAERESHKRR
jgi:putative DNA primase/helicase